MITLPRFLRLNLRAKYLLSALFLGLSIQLLTLHTDNVREMRDVGLPAALLLPDIQHRMGILKEQTDIAEMQGSVAGDASAEMLHMYVLPDNSALDRLLATIDTFTTGLKQEGLLSNLSPVHVGDATEKTVGDTQTHVTVMPVSFEADLNEEGLKTVFLFQNLAGLLTVSDALTQEEQSTLLHLTEAENPAAVTALESFLSTDLLTYATNTDSVEEQLLKSFTSDAFVSSFHSIMGQSRLQGARALLSGPVGQSLQIQKLWPLRFLIPEKTAIRDAGNGEFHVAVTWDVYNR